MPVYNDEAGLAGWLEAGRDQRLATEGNQRQALEGLMSKNRREELMTDVPLESVHPDLRAGMQPGTKPGTLRADTRSLGSMEKASESLYGRQNRVAQAKSLADALIKNAPGPESPEERRAHLSYAAALQAAGTAGDVDQKLIDAVTTFIGKGEGVVVPGGGKVQSSRTGRVMGPDPAANNTGQPPSPAPFGQKWEPTYDAQAGKWTYKQSPMVLQEHMAGMQDALTKGDLSTAQRHLDIVNALRMIPWTEGGGTIGAGNVAMGLQPGQRLWSLDMFGGPKTPAPAATSNTPTVTPGSMTAPLKSAGPNQENAIEAANTAHMQMGDVMKLLQNPEVQNRMGGLVQNPTGAFDRFLGSGALKVPFTDVSIAKKEMPPEWVDFQQKVALHRQLAQKVLEGLRPNQTQIAALAPAMINDNDAPANALQKAQAWQQYYKDHAAIINNVLGQQRRQQMQMMDRTAPPKTPQQAGGAPASVGVSGTNFDDAVKKWKAGQGR